MYDLEFFQDDQLISKYTGKIEDNSIYKNNDIIYNHKEKKLIRNTDEYYLELNFNREDLFVKLYNVNYEGNINLFFSSVKEKSKSIEIKYQIDEKEPLFSIVITRRNYER